MKLYVKCRELRYNGQSLRYGDEFEASEKDAKILKLIGKATDTSVRPPLRVADPQPVRKLEAAPQVEQRRDLLSEDHTEPATEVAERPPVPGARRRYGRRDMTATEE